MAPNGEKVLTIKVDEAVESGKDSNVKTVIKDGFLVIVIDLARELGESSTGKTMAVGNTHGFQKLSDDLRLNVYLGRKK